MKALERGSQKGIQSRKDFRLYNELSDKYSKRRNLMKLGVINPSLKVFINELGRVIDE